MNEQRVVEELSRITASDSFRSRKQMRRFLSYIVTETLEGRGRYLKQYNIAVHGLGKGEGFSQDENPLVRVEAGRLRRLLADYYNNKGKANSIRINLPKGSYQPEFIENTLSPVVERRKKEPRSSDTPKIYSDSIKVLLGFKCFSPTPENLNLYYLIVRDFTFILKKFSMIKVLSASPENSSRLAGHDYINYIRKDYQADFLLKIDMESLNQRLNLKCLLLHTATEEVAWVHNFDIEEHRDNYNFDAICSKVANELFASDNGIAHQHRGQFLQELIEKEGAEHQLALLYLYNAYRGLTHHELQVALRFCERRLLQQPHDTVTIFVNLHLCLQEYLAGYQITENLNERFSCLVTSALRTAPDNSEAHLFHAFAAYLHEDFELACTALNHALSTNPYAAFNQFFAGSLFYIIGHFEAGEQCIEKAITMSSRYPDWYHVLTFFSSYREGDLQEALSEAKKIYIPWGNIIRAYLYQKMGLEKEMTRELSSVNQEHYFPSPKSSWLSPRTLKENSFLSELLAEIAEMQSKAAAPA